MRVIQKSLVDYNAIDTLIQVQRFIGSKQDARRAKGYWCYSCLS